MLILPVFNRNTSVNFRDTELNIDESANFVRTESQFLYFCTLNCCKSDYNPPALLLPAVLVNIIVIVVYFYPRLRIRLYPEFILVVIIMVSEDLSERIGEVDTALSYEPEGRGFESRFVFYIFLHTFFVLFSGYCSNVQGNLET